MSYQKRNDVLDFLNQFEHKEMYLFIRDEFNKVTNEGDFKDGLTDEKILEELANQASKKYSLSLDYVYKEYDRIDDKVLEYMLSNK